MKNTRLFVLIGIAMAFSAVIAIPALENRHPPPVANILNEMYSPGAVTLMETESPSMSVSVDAVLPLAEALLAPGKVEAPTENKARRLGLNYGVEDVTGPGKVRQVIAKAGVDYKVTESATLGAETGRTIHDPQDAAAWKKTVEEENIATVKYRMSF